MNQGMTYYPLLQNMTQLLLYRKIHCENRKKIKRQAFLVEAQTNSRLPYAEAILNIESATGNLK